MQENIRQMALKVSSELQVTDGVEEYFRLFARDAGLSRERMDWITLALREAINNAILYGNGNDPSKMVEIVMDLVAKDELLIIKVWDEGTGFDVNSLVDPTKEENLLKPRGRGIFLIKQFVDKVDFVCRASKGFGIELTIKLKSGNKG